MITAEIIKDSVSTRGHRITTMRLVYPRMIHAEFMTHRVFSRNASSSRAIPAHKTIADIRKNPAYPEAWGSNKPGMQAGSNLKGWRLKLTKFAWNRAKDKACFSAWLAMKAGAHKQIVNRILEPWSHITVVVTSTKWNNFFALRDHADADPTIQSLASEMKLAREQSVPQLLTPGEWHLPFVSPTEALTYGLENAKRMSASRCARVSYHNHMGKVPMFDQDMDLFNKLVRAELVHASPTEHQATPDTQARNGRWANRNLHGNFRGFIQFRKQIPNEAIQ
jgi:thymidylate synthase ThyX